MQRPNSSAILLEDRSMARIRVLLADDHAVLRTGLRLLINAQEDMKVCGEAADGRQAVLETIAASPDVVVMDLTMPAGGGVAAIESIRQRCPQTRVLVLTMHQDIAYVRTALAAGAHGYVGKQAADRELLHGIRAVCAGQTFVDSTLSAMMVQDVVHLVSDAPTTAPTLERLSGRERQVLELLSRGHTNQQVADRLYLSVKTAETYRARLSRKLGLRDRADFIRYALETGLLSPNRAVAGGWREPH